MLSKPPPFFPSRVRPCAEACVLISFPALITGFSMAGRFGNFLFLKKKLHEWDGLISSAFCLIKKQQKIKKYMANLHTGHSLTPPYFQATALLLLRSNSNRSNKHLYQIANIDRFLRPLCSFSSQKISNRFLIFVCHFGHSFAGFSRPYESGRKHAF